MGLAQNVDKHLLIHIDPVGWGEAAGGAPPVLGLNDEEEARHETLEEVEHVANGLHAVTEGGPHGAVEDHLPLDTTLGREKGGGMHGELELHGRTARHATSGTVGWLTLDREQDAIVGGRELTKAMLANEGLLHGLEMTVGAGIGSTQTLDAKCDADATRPLVELLDLGGKLDKQHLKSST